MFNKIKQFFKETKQEVIAEIKQEVKEKSIPDNQIVNLLRKELSGISVNFVGMIRGVYNGQIQYYDIMDGMDENEKRDFLVAVTNLNNGTLKKIANYLINIQGNMSLRESQNETQRHFALATINGIELFLETIEGLANKPEEPEEKMTDREKHSVI